MIVEKQFRTDINGLRAIAVLSVVIYHFLPNALPGGFSGVDVFFVISGFLMTKIIFTGISLNKFNLLRFYKSRAKRLAPALIFSCFFILIFGWFYLSPSGLTTLSKHVLSSVFFLSNFIYWSESGYFDIASRSKFLLHTWSLSTEWQFYILYPLILCALFKFTTDKMVKIIVLSATIIMFIFSCYSSKVWPDASYFLLPARSWEMLAGGLVYLYPIKISLVARQILSLAGLLVVIASCFIFNDHASWPGYNALAPVLGTAVFLYGNSRNIVLESKPIQAIGLYSYSIYLWHWMVLSIIFYLNPFASSEVQVIGILVSLFFGAFSYYFIEKSNNYKATLSFLSVSLLICFISLSEFSSLDKVRSYTAMYDLNDWGKRYADFKEGNMGGSYWQDCSPGRHVSPNGDVNIDPKCTKNKGPGGVFVLGDSHIGSLSLGIRMILKEDVPYNQLASNACTLNWDNIPSDKTNFAFGVGCDFQNAESKKLIKEIMPSVVIIGKARGHENVNYDKLAMKIKAMGIKEVIIVGPLPQWEPSLPVALSKDKKILGDYLISKSLRKDVLKTNDIIKTKYQKNNEITFANVIDSVCHKVGDDMACKYKIDKDNLITFDYGHLTDSGSLYIANKVIKPLLPKSMVK